MAKPAKVVDVDRGWKAIMRVMAKPSGYARVGFLEGVLEPGTTAPVAQANYAQIAAFNEYGTERSPPRPFMRKAMDDNELKFTKMMELGADWILRGKATLKQVLNELGVAGVKAMRTTIKTAGQWAEPNAPSTVQRKLHRAPGLAARAAAGETVTQPLIDTGTMRNVLWYDVRKGRR